MILFYTNNIKGDIAELPQEEAMHCVKTLRKKVGDDIQFVDGQGNWYHGKIIGTGKKAVSIGIEKVISAHNQRNHYLHIAIAPTKNINRFEWFLEKATEFGIDEITPLLCFHSERKTIRNDRLEKVVVAAMKQSLKAYVPKVNPLTSFKDFLKSADIGESQSESQKFIAHCQDDFLEEKVHLKNATNEGEKVTILIGPEGDFSSNEIESALSQNFQPISLGKERLRTETAGLAACHIVNLVNS
ncbi:MAG: 16S rRNA (uracil1498-N3)-methyltransferase [Cognaticolwellia sp.]|jgi:16S rRNA (uracil1498-N3)-methyltransferase